MSSYTSTNGALSSLDISNPIFHPHGKRKNRRYLRGIYKTNFRLQQLPGIHAKISRVHTHCNLTVFKLNPKTNTKGSKNPLINLACSIPSRVSITLPQSLRQLKKLTRTLHKLGGLNLGVTHKSRSIFSIFYFVLAQPNLLEIYKTSLYHATTQRKPTRKGSGDSLFPKC